MGIEAKPPVRRGPGVGTVVLATFLAVLVCGAVLFGGVLLGFRTFGRSAPSHMEPPPHVMNAHEIPRPMSPQPMSTDFVARLTAAKRIASTTDRDEALRSLASKYAQSSGEAVSAIREIRENDERDGAAWDVARRFSESNQSHHAVEVAELIADRWLSDAVSRAIATGEWPDSPGSQFASELSAATTETVAEERAH